MTTVKKVRRRKRVRLGIRKKINGTQQRPRLSVFRSNKGIYAQVIDDLTGKTLAAASLVELDEKGRLNVDNSKKVGMLIADKAIQAGIKEVVFDRGGYLFHGNVKALAEGAREKGLKF